MEIVELINDLKRKIVEVLDLSDVAIDEIGEEDQLVGGSLGIDSIDVLELVMMVDKEYGVKIETQETGEVAFRSVKSLALYIMENK